MLEISRRIILVITFDVCGAAVSRESVCVWDCENPVMTFPVKKEINTELFIE